MILLLTGDAFSDTLKGQKHCCGAIDIGGDLSTEAPPVETISR